MEHIDRNIRRMRPHRHPGHHGDMRVFFAIALVVVGIVLILNNLKLIPPEIKDVIFHWEMILILIGVMNLFVKRHFAVGIILICLGGFFLIPDLYDVPGFHRMFWPVFFVALGLIILFKGRRYVIKDKEDVKDSEDLIDDISVFGGSERRITSKNLKGGKVTAIFGGSQLDMVDASLAEGTNVLEIFALFGGTKMIVPGNWDISIEVSPVFGGFSDKRTRIPEEGVTDGKRLVIKGFVLFGGGELRSV